MLRYHVPNVVQMRDLLIWQTVTMFHAANVVHAVLHQVATGSVSHGTMTPAAPSTLCHCVADICMHYPLSPPSSTVHSSALFTAAAVGRTLPVRDRWRGSAGQCIVNMCTL